MEERCVWSSCSGSATGALRSQNQRWIGRRTEIEKEQGTSPIM